MDIYDKVHMAKTSDTEPGKKKILKLFSEAMSKPVENVLQNFEIKKRVKTTDDASNPLVHSLLPFFFI